MAARLNPRHQDLVRAKIQASQLINRLQDHVLKGVELPPSAVTAALGLLKKCIPDLQVTQLTDSDGGPLVVSIMRFDGQLSGTVPSPSGRLAHGSTNTIAGRLEQEEHREAPRMERAMDQGESSEVQCIEGEVSTQVEA